MPEWTLSRCESFAGVNTRPQWVRFGRPTTVALELEREIDNLVQFVIKGNSSESVRRSLSEKESELRQVQQEIETLKAKEKNYSLDVSEDWVAKRIAGFRELLNSKKDKIPLIRHELRNILKDQIIMTPTGEGRQRHYVATVTGRPLQILADLQSVSQVSSATGISTMIDTCVVVEIGVLSSTKAKRLLVHASAA